jgi:hypothetical protein
LQHHRHPMPDLVLRYGGHRSPCQHRLHGYDLDLAGTRARARFLDLGRR